MGNRGTDLGLRQHRRPLELYAKSGVLDAVRFSTRGIKNMQFVKLDGAWRISALAWDDERPGLAIPSAL